MRSVAQRPLYETEFLNLTNLRLAFRGVHAGVRTSWRLRASKAGGHPNNEVTKITFY